VSDLFEKEAKRAERQGARSEPEASPGGLTPQRMAVMHRRKMRNKRNPGAEQLPHSRDTADRSGLQKPTRAVLGADGEGGMLADFFTEGGLFGAFTEGGTALGADTEGGMFADLLAEGGTFADLLTEAADLFDGLGGTRPPGADTEGGMFADLLAEGGTFADLLTEAADRFGGFTEGGYADGEGELLSTARNIKG